MCVAVSVHLAALKRRKALDLPKDMGDMEELQADGAAWRPACPREAERVRPDFGGNVPMCTRVRWRISSVFSDSGGEVVSLGCHKKKADHDSAAHRWVLVTSTDRALGTCLSSQ